jgi:phage gp29-like protein
MPKPPTKSDLLQRVQTMEVELLTRSLETVHDHRNEPFDALGTLSADRVHAAIIAAERGEMWELFAIYRDVLIADSHLQGLIDTRFFAVLGDEVMITPKDPTKPEDVAAADAIRAAIDRMPDFMGLCSDLLWGTLWPLAMVERCYKPAEVPGLTYDWGDVSPVPDYLMRWTTGRLELAEIDPMTRLRNGVFFRPETSRYITHRGHLLRHPDCWGGPMRALMWWFLLKTMDREWWVRFLDRFGTPFPVAKFEKNDDRSRQILERALKLSTRIGGIVVSSNTSVELVQAQTAAADAHQKFYSLCNDEMARRVLGQTLSSTSAPTGIGSGASTLQGQVRDDICKYDKIRLVQTLRGQFVRPWLRLNGFAGAVPNLTFGGDEVEANGVTAEVLSKLKTAGVRITDKSLPDLSKRIGLELERDPSPAPTPTPAAGIKALSAALPRADDPDAAAASISREAAASITQAYRGSLAPVAQILLSAATPTEATTRLLAAFTDWDATKVAEVVETGLVAGAWNGVTS